MASLLIKQENAKIHALGGRNKDGFVRVEGLQQVEDDSSSTYSSQRSLTGKPWKKHGNRKKKEKLKRQFADHDVHDKY